MIFAKFTNLAFPTATAKVDTSSGISIRCFKFFYMTTTVKFIDHRGISKKLVVVRLSMPIKNRHNYPQKSEFF